MDAVPAENAAEALDSAGGLDRAGAGDGPAAVEPPAPSGSFQIGQLVCLEGQLPYLKSADPMPMLRPPDLVDGGEQGQVVEIRPFDQLAVRFRRGTFLIAARNLRQLGSDLKDGG